MEEWYEVRDNFLRYTEGGPSVLNSFENQIINGRGNREVNSGWLLPSYPSFFFFLTPNRHTRGDGSAYVISNKGSVLPRCISSFIKSPSQWAPSTTVGEKKTRKGGKKESKGEGRPRAGKKSSQLFFSFWQNLKKYSQKVKKKRNMVKGTPRDRAFSVYLCASPYWGAASRLTSSTTPWVSSTKQHNNYHNSSREKCYASFFLWLLREQ